MITIIKESEINKLDDMADLFYRIAEALGHPMHKISIDLTKTWGEQDQDKAKRGE